MMRFVFHRTKNIVEKRGNTSYQHFLLFHEVFKRLFLLGHKNQGVLGIGLTLYSTDTHFDASTTVFENIAGQGEITRHEQFLLFPQCYLHDQIIVSPCVHIFGIISLFAAEFGEPKIGISDRGLTVETLENIYHRLSHE